MLKKDLKTKEESKLKSEDVILGVDARKIAEFTDKNKLTLNGYFNFAFAFTLSKFIYKSDAYFTTIYNGRKSSKEVNTVSMLVKTLPVYVQYAEDDKVIDKLTEMKNLLSDLQENDLFSFADAANAFGLNADVNL